MRFGSPPADRVAMSDPPLPEVLAGSDRSSRVSAAGFGTDRIGPNP
ncbi:hypothetical protein FTUN_2165 [Frigoriglobus tundricola]|uniref:Uncharacterized protein n=1 Tax=Frigoriglobus tundricola TaxID=2774151 RepID=A0A6M5YMX6_9BACT|nr:hypothetical protein FTUN_2165 [Frigoriglobus tundricola]